MRVAERDGVLEQLANAGWQAGEFRGCETVAGGVHAAHRLRFAHADVFLKTSRVENAAMLDDELDGLIRLRATGTLAMPSPLASDVAGDIAWLALQWLDLHPASPEAQATLGRQLAALHRCASDRHGWHRDNHIGLVRQSNAWSENWCEFFAERRLGFQLRLAERHADGEWVRRGFELLDALPRMLGEHRPPPSTLHGDLWGGNIGMRADGEPVAFDPAAYCGDRETDLAMTELFGGFVPAFYAAYEEEWPLEKEYAERRPLYQLYHVLNHANMFGGGYARRAAAIIASLLARLR